eukprot:8834413-Pyramimonas_sp.AAC.1
MPRSGARSASRSNSTVSIMEARWNPNPNCAPQAESRCPGQANWSEGACRNPVCKSCSDVCNKCNKQWLRTECYPMDEHNC